MHTIVNALGSVVDMYSVLSLNNHCRVSELEELIDIVRLGISLSDLEFIQVQVILIVSQY